MPAPIAVASPVDMVPFAATVVAAGVTVTVLMDVDVAVAVVVAADRLRALLSALFTTSVPSGTEKDALQLFGSQANWLLPQGHSSEPEMPSASAASSANVQWLHNNRIANVVYERGAVAKDCTYICRSNSHICCLPMTNPCNLLGRGRATADQNTIRC